MVQNCVTSEDLSIMQCRVPGTKFRSVHLAMVAMSLVLLMALSREHSIPESTTPSFREASEPLDLSFQIASSAICSPRGIHLALRSDVNDDLAVSMTVSFFLPFLPCRDARPIVRYGKKFLEHDAPTLAHIPDPLHLEYASRMTGNRTFLSPWVYHVELSRLEAGNRDYWYRIDVVEDALAQDQLSVLNKSNITIGEIHYFRTPPLPGSPTSIAIVADLGDTMISHRTTRGIQEATLIAKQQFAASLVIVAGDIAYADGEPWLYPKWFTHVESLFRHVPLSVSVGNHEVEVSITVFETM